MRYKILYNGRDLLRLELKRGALSEKEADVKFSLNRSTGIFSGTTGIAFENEAAGGRKSSNRSKGMKASYSGVVLPGWYSDCSCSEDEDTLIPRESLPFGIGFCVFSDKVGRASVKRGCAAGIGSAK